MRRFISLIIFLCSFFFIIDVNAKANDDLSAPDSISKKIKDIFDKKDQKEYFIEDEENYNDLYKEYLKLSDEQKKQLKYAPSLKYKQTPSLNENFKIRNNLKAGAALTNSYAAAYDLREDNRAPSMSDQGYLGLCWAFSFNSTLESYLISHNYASAASSYNFSEIAAHLQQYYLANLNTFAYSQDASVYTYASGIEPIGNALQNWLFFNPVLEGSIGNSSFDGILGGRPFTYNNINNSFIYAYNHAINYGASQSYARQYAYQYIDEIFNEIDPSLVTQKQNSPFIVSPYKVISYYNSLLYSYSPNLTASLKSSVSSQIDLIKDYIINNGAATTITVVPLNLNAQKGEIFINNNFPVADYNNYMIDKEGHAVTIIGWDDNVGDINNDGVNDGAWLVQNSWGEDSNAAYFYLSYYDVFALQGVYGINNVENNVFDNSYKYVDNTLAFDKNGNLSYEFNYYKGEKREKVDLLKVYLLSSEKKKISATITDGVNTCESLSNSTLLNDGIVDLKFNNCYLSGDIKVNIYTMTSNNTNKYYEGDVLRANLYTSNVDEVKSYDIDINESESTAVYKNYVFNNLSEFTFNLKRNGNINEDLISVAIIDENKKNITDKFKVTVDFSALNTNESYSNDYIYISFSGLNSKKIDIKFYYDSQLIKTFNYNVENIRMDKDYIYIEKPIDLLSLNGSSGYYFKLVNDIDLTSLTSNGGLFQGGLNLDSFGVYLDGQGKSIIGYNGSNGGLFNNISYSEIYNLEIKNFDVSSSGTAGLLANNSYINIFLRINSKNNKINSNIAGGLIGIETLSYFSDIYTDNLSITGTSASGGVVGKTLYDEFTTDSYERMLVDDSFIRNVFIQNSTFSSTKSGTIYGQSEFILKDNSSKIVKYLSDLMYFNNNRTSYYYNLSAKVYNGNSYSTISNPSLYFSSSNIKNVSTSDIKNTVNVFKSFNYPFWIVKNGQWPYLKYFVDGYNYYSFDEQIERNGNVVKKENSMNIYLVKPTNNVNEFIENIDIKVEVFDGTSEINKSGTSKIVTGDKIFFDDDIDNKLFIMAVMGDVNADGDTNILDFKLLANYLLSPDTSSISSSEIKKAAADINMDNDINILDFKKVGNYLINDSF